MTQILNNILDKVTRDRWTTTLV